MSTSSAASTPIFLQIALSGASVSVANTCTIPLGKRALGDASGKAEVEGKTRFCPIALVCPIADDAARPRKPPSTSKPPPLFSRPFLPSRLFNLSPRRRAQGPNAAPERQERRPESRDGEDGLLAPLLRGPARLLQRPRPRARPRRLLRRHAPGPVLAAARRDLGRFGRREQSRRGRVDVGEERRGSVAAAAVVRGRARSRVPLRLRRRGAHQVRFFCCSRVLFFGPCSSFPPRPFSLRRSFEPSLTLEK